MKPTFSNRQTQRAYTGCIYILCHLKALQLDKWESVLSNTDIQDKKNKVSVYCCGQSSAQIVLLLCHTEVWSSESVEQLLSRTQIPTMLLGPSRTAASGRSPSTLRPLQTEKQNRGEPWLEELNQLREVKKWRHERHR